jgi:tRNA threonylcarbamoyladenosine biosynthesis protein TsaB
MNLLAIDTCTEACSVSLYKNDTQFSRLVNSGVKSSSLILPLCEAVFIEANINPKELQGIVYTKGPGSFTGVRMCIGVVQGLSLAHNIPTLGFSTLELLGFEASKKLNHQKIAVALDARMGEVYFAVYHNNILRYEILCKPDEAPKLEADFVGVGTAWAVYPVLKETTGIQKFEPNFYPQAQYLIELALKNLSSFESDVLPMPTYLRNNVAVKSVDRV